MGAVVGAVVGTVVGAFVGTVEGAVVGTVVGAVVGTVVGAVVGTVVGAAVGELDRVVATSAAGQENTHTFLILQSSLVTGSQIAGWLRAASSGGEAIK